MSGILPPLRSDESAADAQDFGKIAPLVFASLFGRFYPGADVLDIARTFRSSYWKRMQAAVDDGQVDDIIENNAFFGFTAEQVRAGIGARLDAIIEKMEAVEASPDFITPEST